MKDTRTEEAREWEYGDHSAFRRGPVEVVRDEAGHEVKIRQCQELVEGRWEPFISIVKACAICEARQARAD